MSGTRRLNLELPGTVAGLLCDLHARGESDKLNWAIHALNRVGWTYRSISRALDMSSEAVRLRAAKARPCGFELVAPPPPAGPERHPAHPRRASVDPDPEVIAEIVRLRPLATQAVGKLSAADPRRVASERYAALLAGQVARGVTVYRLSQALGTRQGVLTARMARHGYRPPSPSIAHKVIRKAAK